jgi:hypothetical protein
MIQNQVESLNSLRLTDEKVDWTVQLITLRFSTYLTIGNPARAQA